MAGFKKNVYIINLICLTTVTTTYAINLGLLANDFTRFGSPVVFNKITKHVPVLINIKSEYPARTPQLQTFLSSPSTKLKITEINSLIGKSPLRKFPRSIDIPSPLVPLFVSLLPNVNSLFPSLPGAFGNGLKRSVLNKRKLILK